MRMLTTLQPLRVADRVILLGAALTLEDNRAAYTVPVIINRIRLTLKLHFPSFPVRVTER